MVWEVFGQALANRFDSSDNAACKIALFELRAHGIDNVIPKLLANPLVDAAVA
jgi:hypothetical protein